MRPAARATQLSWTGSIGYSSPLTYIQGFDFSPSAEFEQPLSCIRRIPGHYRAAESAILTIDTIDAGFWAACNFGDRLSDVALTIASAIDTDGTPAGTTLTLNISSVVVVGKSGFSHGNNDSSPLVGSITFQLSTPQGDSDASWSIT